MEIALSNLVNLVPMIMSVITPTATAKRTEEITAYNSMTGSGRPALRNA